jgi:hypothetical protein
MPNTRSSWAPPPASGRGLQGTEFRDGLGSGRLNRKNAFGRVGWTCAAGLQAAC